jgi:hypothetical protein
MIKIILLSFSVFQNKETSGDMKIKISYTLYTFN